MNLYYQKIGNGQKILLAFHGMGQDFSCFLKFAETFANQYTTYLFDLPYHGSSEGVHGSKYLENEVVTKAIWVNYLTIFLQENQIQNFSIIAFSMGGRFALATVEAFSEKIEKLFLLAPDGISETPFYNFVTRFRLSRKVFKSVLTHNHKFHTSVQTLVRAGLVHESVFKFAKIMVDTPQKQKQLYRAWIGFHQLRFDMKSLAQLINHQEISVKFFTGKYDKLLPTHKVFPLSKHLHQVDVITLEASHGRLVDKVLTYFMNHKC
jgi:pimeloyl-ACP methyl ester carboxylesterase